MKLRKKIALWLRRRKPAKPKRRMESLPVAERTLVNLLAERTNAGELSWIEDAGYFPHWIDWKSGLYVLRLNRFLSGPYYFELIIRDGSAAHIRLPDFDPLSQAVRHSLVRQREQTIARAVDSLEHKWSPSVLY